MMDLEVRRWTELGVVGTIYEEENEDSSSSLSSSLGSSPSLTPQHSNLNQPRSLQLQCRSSDPDVVIHVHGACFRLHKDALISRSAYLKRHLSEIPEITLSPPLNITPQTFSLVTDFCYGTHITVTPFNVAALLTAAELLAMTETSDSGDENLKQITEAYFRRVVAVNRECASIVLSSCFPLLPEAETTASLVSRCIEALNLTAGDDGDVSYLEGFKNVMIEDLKLIVESTSQRLTDRHDLLYRIIDTYLKENIGKIGEDEKIQICNYIDCSILSPQLIMHAVQNPRMPLRFVVQAMFLQQLNTRRSIISAATDHHHHQQQLSHPEPEHSASTLGAILQRDAALRQVSQLKAVMTATNTRIHTLEKELSGMKKLLNESEIIDNRIDSARSASFRFSSEGNKVERGQIGSVSSLSYRDAVKKVGAKRSSSSEGSSEGSHTGEKNLGRRLINGLKSAFRLQKKSERKADNKNGEKVAEEGENEGKIVIVKKDRAFHKRDASH